LPSTKAKVFLPPLLPWGLALVGLLVSLLLWRLLLNAAQWFSLAYALAAAACYLASPFFKQPLLKAALNRAGSLCAILSICAALGLGAFLPPAAAGFLSPALGRFGGLAGLAVLAALHLGRAMRFNKSGRLALAIFCATGAAWVALNTATQANFPPPPTSKDEWAGLLAGLLGLAVSGGVAGLLLNFRPETRWAAPACLRWSLASSLVGLALAGYFQQGLIALGCGLWLAALVSLALLFVRRGSGTSGTTPLNLNRKTGLKEAGLTVILILGIGLLYLPVGEQLETVLLRNTLEHYAQQGWAALSGQKPFDVMKASGADAGSITGRVTDNQGQPLAGANLVVSDPTGYTWTATSDISGHYTLSGVAASHYLPVAARAGYLDAVAVGAGPLGPWRMVASVRAGQTTANVDFVMQPRQPYRVAPGNSLKLDQFSQTSRDYPVPSQVLRRTFSFERAGLQKSGIAYEPLPEQGPGPFPILLIVYPGPANAWEGVSIPLAAQGFVVIAYQPELFGPHPERGLDLRGDVEDLLELYSYAKAGYFSDRSDPQKVVVTSGSVSTAYTYLLLREIETSSPADKAALKGGIAYGGLADLYRYRYDWARGALYIDPGIQDLETMLVALGRPDLRPEIYLLFSPVFHLQPGSLPPMLLVHTTKDTIVPVYQNTLLVNALEKQHLPYKSVIYQDIEHYLDTSKPDPDQRDMLEKTIEFLKAATG
jgi:fermentation-respiration switch protein FrsA (DUF1100 family)